MDVTLDIDKLLNVEDARIFISAGSFNSNAEDTNFTVKGFIVGEFTVTGNNEYKSLFELASQATLQSLITQVGALSGSTTLANLKITSVSQTRQTWLSSGIPSFSLPMIFVATKPSDDVREPVRQLSKTVYPTFTGKDSGIIKPPLGYALVGKDTVGTMLVQIGNWFRAPGQIMKDISFTFSKEVTDNGTPLYASGNITFMPSKMIDFKTFQSYLNASQIRGKT